MHSTYDKSIIITTTTYVVYVVICCFCEALVQWEFCKLKRFSENSILVITRVESDPTFDELIANLLPRSTFDVEFTTQLLDDQLRMR